jgi:hypothetical protein
VRLARIEQALAPPSAEKQGPRTDRPRRSAAGDAASRANGEERVCGEPRAETRFQFRTGIPSSVPWLVVVRLEALRARLAMAKP